MTRSEPSRSSSSPTTLGTLEIACPIGVVCDENFDYRAYRLDTDELYLSLSFDPSIVLDRDLESLQEAFNYANLRLRFPDRSDDENVRYYAQDRDPIRELTFTSFEDSRLRFSLSGEFDRVTEETSDDSNPDCSTGDILGLCYRDLDADISYDIEFDLEIPPG